MPVNLPPLLNDVSESQLLETAIAVGLPMNTRFRGTTVREALLVKGPRGWAEFSAFPEYGDPEAAVWLSATIEAGWHDWPTPRVPAVPINATVPAVPAEEVSRVLDRYGTVGTVKVKVAEQPKGDPVAGVHGLEADIKRVAAVRAYHPDARIRVDANQAWTVDQAAAALKQLAQFDLQYAEQPVAGIQGLKQLRQQLDRAGVPVPLAADEAVRKATDPLEVARVQAAEFVVVKVQPLGGVRRAAAIVEASGLTPVVSSALDTSVGLAAGVRLAASLPVEHACGLGTAALFSADVTDQPLVPVDGVISAEILPEVNEGNLEEIALPPQRQEWWRARASRCLKLLQAAG